MTAAPGFIRLRRREEGVFRVYAKKNRPVGRDLSGYRYRFVKVKLIGSIVFFPNLVFLYFDFNPNSRPQDAPSYVSCLQK
ncbi:hypothetical protein CBW57_17850 [Yersinia intermedia]|uniref:Uncharacterized protein n=1 Tax=Yersinia intermedia TaxID=631 RepID=A0A208ZUG7_YERIN|nr:hypothetical protein CBW57_17850 [Yersinia intermedia]